MSETDQPLAPLVYTLPGVGGHCPFDGHLSKRMESARTYSRWATTMRSLHDPTAQLLQTLPSVPIPLRKVLLAMTRIQRYPRKGSRVLERYRTEWYTMVQMTDSTGKTHGWGTLLNLVEPLFAIDLTPTFAGFLSSCIRSAPYQDYSSVEEALESAIRKEIAASITVIQRGKVNYKPILSKTADRAEEVFEGVPGNSEVASQIYRSFCQSREALRHSTVFPKVSKKTVGPESTKDIQETLRYVPYDKRFEEVEPSIKLIERIYHLTGIQIKGAVELRSAWKFNDLKPRVYFAQGGDVYPSTKFVQPIFNTILEHFDMVHPLHRFNPPEEGILPSDILVIYDYTSFTSSLDEIKSFIKEIADFYSGTEITVVDTNTGPRTQDLGELLHEYNRTANHYAYCDVTKLLSLDDPTFIRHTCGMLGVPGNISSCTLLHGIFTAFVVQSTKKSRCVGDDARLHWGGQHTYDLYLQLASFGDVARDKMESWTKEEAYSLDNAWSYCKRPLNRLPQNRVSVGQLVIFPTLDTVLGLKDDFHRYIPQKETRVARAGRLSSQWSRLLKTLWSQMIPITEFDRELLYHLQMDWLRRHNLLLHGKVGTRIDGHYIRVPLVLQKDEFGMDPDVFVLQKMPYQEKFEFPEYDPISRRPYGFQGEEFRSISGKALALAETLGYVESKPIFAKYSREMVGDRFFLVLYNGQYPDVHRYTVRYSFPRWLPQLIPDNVASV